jgi:hypothetical protein
MKKLTSIAICGILMLSLSSCGYSGFYRYPCQDPKNWELAECNPPACEANGLCTKDLVPKELIITDGASVESSTNE